METITERAIEYNTLLLSWAWKQSSHICPGMCLGEAALPSACHSPALPVQVVEEAELHESRLHLLARKCLKSEAFCKQIYSSSLPDSLSKGLIK